jgi:hypothetical protein
MINHRVLESPGKVKKGKCQERTMKILKPELLTIVSDVVASPSFLS